MIPKKLHYFWFGRNPKPPIVEFCIASWKKHLPDFEIIEWNEDNFNISQNQFAQDAYNNKKWAFVSDYARAKVLYEEGGFYLDTDMELKNSLSEFVKYKAVCGFETKKVPFSAFWAVEPYRILAKDILNHYEKLNQLDTTPNTKIFSELLVNKYGANAEKDEFQELKNDVVLFPSSYFSLDLPINYITHHFSGSWHSSWTEEKNTFKEMVNMYGILNLLLQQSDSKRKIKDVVFNHKLISLDTVLDQFPTRYIAKYLIKKIKNKILKR